jgi:hypothetical protein
METIHSVFLTEVVPHLTIKDVLAMCQVYHTYHHLTQDDEFWHLIANQRFPYRAKPSDMTWKQLVIAAAQRKFKAQRFDIHLRDLGLKTGDPDQSSRTSHISIDPNQGMMISHDEVHDEYSLAEVNGMEIDELADFLTQYVKKTDLYQNLSRGDCVWIAEFDYRNDGRFFWDGQKVIPQMTEPIDYGTLPDQFLTPTEFDPDYFAPVEGYAMAGWFDLPKFQDQVLQNLTTDANDVYYTSVTYNDQTYYLVMDIDEVEGENEEWHSRSLEEIKKVINYHSNKPVYVDKNPCACEGIILPDDVDEKYVVYWYLDEDKFDEFGEVTVTTEITFPPGHYYIGDPCYILSDTVWDHWCNTGMKNGENIYNGSKWAIDSTHTGDGLFEGTNGYAYPVDAGSLGIVPEALFDPHKRDIANGTFHTFETEIVFTVALYRNKKTKFVYSHTNGPIILEITTY